MTTWPVAVPATVSVPSAAAVSAAQRFDRLVGTSIPLDQIDAALAIGGTARTELRKAMKALRQAKREAAAERDAIARAAAKYARDEDRLTAQRAAEISGTRMATQLSGAALARTFA